MNPFYNHTSGVPVSQSRGVSSSIRAEFDLVDAGFDTANTAINLKVSSASPALTGTPTAPTAAPLTSTTQVATTEFSTLAVAVETARAIAAEALKAPLASPTFTGTPTAPTATLGTSTTQIATTAFVAATGLSTALPGQSGNAGKFITTDGTNASWVDPFAPGTAMLFAQTAAPTGWTKSTTHNNKALRVVSGTAGSGGTAAFTTVFTNRTPAGSVTVDGTTLTESQIPAHTHTTNAYKSSGTGSGAVGGSSFINYIASSSITSSSIGGGASHTHTASFTGSAMDFAVQYVDVIIATKD